MRQVFGGAVLVIAGVAAFIEAHSHRPMPAVPCPKEGPVPTIPPCTPTPASGLSNTAYDLLRICAWALVIIGGLLVVTGLIRYWAQAREARQ
jgi:hypothetical protein